MRSYYDTLETVLRSTETALAVEIQSVGKPTQDGFHLALEMTATPLKILFGTFDHEVLVCTYVEGLPHRRGQTQVSPRVSGSGLELKIKKGERVIFLLSSNRTLLRAETLDHADPIAEYGRARPGARPDPAMDDSMTP
jgi:hypothetical protein